MKKYIFLDIEVYKNRVMVGLLNSKNNHIVLDGCDQIRKLFTQPYNDKNNIFITFNGWNYDLPIIESILNGASESIIYQMSQDIVNNKTEAKSWKKEHIDLLCLIPKIAKCSLKEMGFRLNYPILENLPYAYDKDLNEREWNHIKNYNLHDLNIAKLLFKELKGEYQARMVLAKDYDFHTLWSGSAGLAKKVFKINSVKIKHDLIKPRGLDKIKHTVLYKNVYAVLFSNSPFQDKINQIISLGKNQNINGVDFDLSVGGFHSKPKADIYYNVYDYDFASMYPNLCVNNNIGGESFNGILKDIIDKRMYYKRNNMKNQSDAYKLIINSITGCFKDQYASDTVLSPNSSLSMLLAGQFTILDLICRVNDVIYSNTDSIFTHTKLPKEFLEDVYLRTGLRMDGEHYDKVIIVDVNNILCIKDGEIVKAKGCFTSKSIYKNPKASVIVDTLYTYFSKGINVEESIKKCNDLSKFAYFTRVVGDNYFSINNEKIEDKRIKFYCSKKGETIMRNTEKIKATLIKSSDVSICMNDKDIIKDNINYNYYIDECFKIIDKVEGK